MKTARAASRVTLRQTLRRRGTSHKIKQASTGAPADVQRIHEPVGATTFAVAAVVVKVSVEFAVLSPERFTEGGMKLIVGKSCAPAGLPVIAALRATVPTKPLVVAMVMTELLEV